MREPSLLSAAAGSPLPAAFYRVFRERSPVLLALLQVAFGGNGQGGGTITTVTGVSPIALANALAKPIRSLIQYGKCVSSGGAVYCNNGVIKYGALGANLLDPSAANTVLGYYINKADGEEKLSPYNFMFAGYMPVTPGKTYVAYGRGKSDNDLSDYNRVAWYDSTKTWISGANYTQNQIAVVTAPPNAAYARFSCNPSGGTTVTVTQEIVDGYNWMFAEGTAEITPFVPFVGGIVTDGTPETLTISATGETAQTITDIPDLFATLDGSVRDEVDLVSGVLTRRTEAVYENGAVVIRALATPATEQTTPHALRSYAGDTTVSWTAAVEGTEKTVEFAQGETASNKVGTAKVGTAKVA